MLGEHGFDFAELDAMPAELDLMIDAALELEHSVAPPAATIARAIQAPTRYACIGIRHEPLGGEIGSTVITARDAASADVELPPNSECGRPHPLVEHVELGASDGNADGRRSISVDAVCVDSLARRPDRGFGRTVDVPQLGSAHGNLTSQGCGQCFTAAEEAQTPAVAFRDRPARREQHAISRWRRLHHRRRSERGKELLAIRDDVA
jgi:hypothetical protein